MRLKLTFTIDLPNIVTVPGIAKFVQSIENYVNTMQLGLFERGKPGSANIVTSYSFEHDGVQINIPRAINEA